MFNIQNNGRYNVMFIILKRRFLFTNVFVQQLWAVEHAGLDKAGNNFRFSRFLQWSCVNLQSRKIHDAFLLAEVDYIVNFVVDSFVLICLS